MATAEKVPAPDSVAIDVVAAYQLKLLVLFGTELQNVAASIPIAKSTEDAPT
jgi:hypothetical protein